MHFISTKLLIVLAAVLAAAFLAMVIWSVGTLSGGSVDEVAGSRNGFDRVRDYPTVVMDEEVSLEALFRPVSFSRVRPGDNMDVYWSLDGASVNSPWQGIAERVEITSVVPLGTTSGGMERANVSLRTTQSGSRQIANYRETGQIALAWPQFLFEDTGVLTPDPGGLFDLGTLARRPFEASCQTVYKVAGVEYQVPVACSHAPVDREAAELVGQLKSAELAFNHPNQMALGDAMPVELVLAPATVKALADLPDNASDADRARTMGLSGGSQGETQVVSDIDYSLQMEATLSGLDFEVSPSGPQRRTVLPTRPANWTWTIEPKKPGEEKVLMLLVSAIVEGEEQNLPPVEIRTFTKRIHVTVSGWDQAVFVARQVSALHGAIAAVAASLIAVLGWVVARLRRAPKPTTDPLLFVAARQDEQDSSD